MKVLLILVDGMRPDALEGIPQMEAMRKRSSYILDGKTVVPSYTLPCHMSMFHSVEPFRHGTTTNTFAPQMRPVEGLCEVIRKKKLRTAFFYSWEELRDLTRPGGLSYSVLLDEFSFSEYEQTQAQVVNTALQHLKKDRADFIFCYMGWPDDAGHRNGWMSQPYLRSIRESWEQIARLLEAAGQEYTVIVTADHGGHDRMHGTDMPEDTTVPAFFCGPDFAPGRELESYSIIDMAPTIAKVMGLECPDDWEGRSMI